MEKTKKQTIWVIALALLLVIAVSYIAVGKYQQNKEQRQLAIFQQGAQYGYQQAIIQVVQQAATCQQVPLFVQNQTVNMIAVGCLQQRED